MESIPVNGQRYTLAGFLGRGKGGYSYLVRQGVETFVLKQLHHEPCDCYAFGDKLEAELSDYARLSALGLPMPKLLAVDRTRERLVKEYIDGPTVWDLSWQGKLTDAHRAWMSSWSQKLKAAGLNIDYYPTNFVVRGDALFYIDYECNLYSEQWNYENWGAGYWENREQPRVAPPKKDYQTYLFDLYGTLADIHTDEESPEFWQNVARDLDFDRPEALKQAYGAGVRAAQEAAEADSRLFPEIDLAPVLENLLIMGEKPHDSEAVRRFGARFRELSLRKLTLFPGAKELLEGLRKKGKAVYLLSNAQALFTRPELEMLGLSGCFDGIMLSSEAGVKKPDPRFYLAMLQKYAIDPERALMVGNDDLADCHGAAAAGLDSRYVATEQSPPCSGPLPERCRVIQNISQAEE